jgi:hypothetical protein
VISLHRLELVGVLVVLVRVVHHVLSLLLLNVVILRLQLPVVNLVDAIHVLLVLNLHHRDMHLQGLNFIHKAFALKNLGLMLLSMFVGLDSDLLGGDDDGLLELSSLHFRLLDVAFVLIDIIADITEDIDLLIESEEGGLHSLDLDVSITQGKLQLLVFLHQVLRFLSILLGGGSLIQTDRPVQLVWRLSC